MESIDIGTGKIAAALAKAQAEMANPKFDSQNPHFRNKFASLASVRNAVVPVLAKHGIAMTQDLGTTDDGKGILCLTTLHHESGELLRFGPLVMPASKPDAQGFGSAATYARRYSLMAVCGVVGDEDDDANAASGRALKDNSGRPDTSEVDHEKAEQYADLMRTVLHNEDPFEALQLHEELNQDKALYTAAADLAGAKAKWKDLLRKAKEAA